MKKYRLSFFLGFMSTIVVTAITLTMDSWAPTGYRWIESIGNFQLKPWIFFAPAVACLAIIALAFQRFRNPRDFSALLAGSIASVVVGGLALLALIALSLPNMRY